MPDVVLSPLADALRDRYLLERELGRGGMATVWLARDLKHDRAVALKVLHSDLAAAVGPERFQREIRLAARLQHPHILTVLDSGGALGLLWYTMPYVAGQSVRERLRERGALEVGEAISIAREVAEALDCAHTQGVVHRDIKPENILLSRGHALVVDFGIARAPEWAGTESLTATGMVVGTPAYMSPEQALGERDLDGRTDIYSLGCVLYEMLAGESPFSGLTPLQMVSRRLSGPAPSLTDARPAVPGWLDAVVSRAMAREPEERFASAADLRDALAQSFSSAGAVTMPASARAAPRERSIAVLPFTNMSNDPDNEYFTDGVAEEIVNALSKIQALRVASRTSSFAFKGKQLDMGQIGRQLKVATMLEGSVRKSGTRLRIAAQLIDVTNGFHLWSERYDRELADVFAIQDDIAQSIVQALEIVLTEQDRRAIHRAAPADIEAYDYYLRGRQLQHQGRRKTFDHALQMYARAIEIDPAFAAAYAGIADCRSFLFMWHDSTEQNLREADVASRKALELDPDSAEAHASRGLAVSLRGEYDEAAREFEAAIRIAPKLFEAHYFYARACFARGQFDEAVRHFKDAIRARPEDYQTPNLLSLCYTALGRDAEARAANAQARTVIERHLELYPDDARAIYFGAISLVRGGERERGLEWGRRATAIDPNDASILYNVACAYALAGETDLALDLLERAWRNSVLHRDWIENDPDLVSLRGHPRFEALKARR